MQAEEAKSLVTEKIQNPNLVKHCLACQAAMRELADYFGADQEKWGLAGLLHDIDYEETKDDPANHSLIGADFLRDKGLEEDIAEAVKTHNAIHGCAPATQMAKALYCVDPLTGLIVATALVLPSRRIQDVTAENVINRFREKSFAKGANRETIQQCEPLLGMDLSEFIGVVLRGMQGVAQELGV